ncbi:MAG: hypothetical protein Q9159_002862 [Coniocarpon cinnabarinum]
MPTSGESLNSSPSRRGRFELQARGQVTWGHGSMEHWHITAVWTIALARTGGRAHTTVQAARKTSPAASRTSRTRDDSALVHGHVLTSVPEEGRDWLRPGGGLVRGEDNTPVDAGLIAQ